MIDDVSKYGDLQLVDLGNEYLVIACDSSGSIGNKRDDVIQLEPEIAGYYAAFVPLVELMCVRAELLSVVDTLSVEMEPTGRRIIEGILKALDEVGLGAHALNGSTEDNMPSTSTGIGVTVIGRLPKNTIAKSITSKDVLVLIGKPKVGQEFLEEEIMHSSGETLRLSWMYALRQESCIQDMIPVGSKGVEHEINVLMQRYHVSYEPMEIEVDKKKSAGPATCIVAIINDDEYDGFIKRHAKVMPIYKLGTIKE